MTTSNPVHIMIVDDSIVYRMLLKEVVRSLPEANLYATASNGREALDTIAQRNAPPDLVFLDLQMPVMDGLETLSHLKARYPEIGVVIISGINQENAELTIQALEAGALDFIKKPDGDGAEQNFNALREQLEAVLLTGIEREKSFKPRQQRSTKPIKALSEIKAIVIGISTGGPKALMEVIPALPQNLDVPVLIVQHMPPIFTRSLAESLNLKSRLRVKEAQAGEVVQAGTVYIAPGGLHMGLIKSGDAVFIDIHNGPPENSCRPAVDVMFRAAGQVYGKHTLAAIMTGMGNDGAAGMKQLKQLGCYCLSQTAESCVIYGMPRTVDELGLPDEHVELKDFGDRLFELVQRSHQAGKQGSVA